ncbi:MAG: type VI secretion system protein TssR domain-containing protein, partial [Bacteroidota bacterium]
MKRLPLYTLLCTLLTGGIIQLLPAQIAAGAKALQIPSKYINPSADVDLGPVGKNAVMKGTVWYVYSDRDGNKTTAGPGKGGAMQTLSFLEDMVVYEEEGNYLHVVKDPGIDRRGQFSATAVDYGWIAKDKLLLWGHCLLTADAAKMNKKAMILNTLESLSGGNSDKFNKMASNEVKFFKDPGLKVPSTRSSGLFSVFFIYKVNNSGKVPSVLLGRSERARNGPRIRNVIEGWVPINRIVQWDHRVALEPNWESKAAAERQGANKPVKFFKDRASAGTYRAGGTPGTSSVLWNADPFNKRNLGEWRRFPVLDNTGSTVKVGLMGDINSKHGTMLPTVMAKIQDRHGTAKAGLRNIDIVFVVDGTSSMGPYFPPIAKAIQNSINGLSTKDISPNKIRFGAVVYRDYAENNRKVETVRLNKNGREVADFLLKIDAKDYHDKDKPEAVFFGLREAIRNTGMNKDHTNIVVLVGDAGNHSRSDMTQVSSEDIIKLFGNYNVNFLAFQAKNDGGDQTFNDFTADNKQIIRSVGRNKYNKIKGSSVVKIRYPVWRTDGTENGGKLDGGAMAGSLITSTE